MNWDEAWRKWVAPQLKVHELEALRKGLETDDPALVQNYVTLTNQFTGGVACGCAVAYAGWKGNSLSTVVEVRDFFVSVSRKSREQECPEHGTKLSQRDSAFQSFVRWFDATPRHQMRPKLLAEVIRSLEERRALA
jgi:hypothetical protein